MPASSIKEMSFSAVVSGHSVCPMSVIDGMEPARAVSRICGYFLPSSVNTCTCVSTMTISAFHYACNKEKSIRLFLKRYREAHNVKLQHEDTKDTKEAIWVQRSATPVIRAHAGLLIFRRVLQGRS